MSEVAGVGNTYDLFVNKLEPVMVSGMYLIDKFALIAKLFLVCQAHISK